MKTSALLRFTTAALMLLACTLTVPAEALTSYYRHIEWTSVDEGVDGLFAYQIEPTIGDVSRLLIGGPGDARVIVDRKSDAAAGTVTYRILDDDSGWWIELVVRLPAGAESVHAFHRSLLAPDVRHSLELRTSTGLKYQASGFDASSATTPTFVEGFVATKHHRVLLAEAPTGVRRALTMVHDSLASEIEPSRRSIQVAHNVLIEILRLDEDEDVSRWHLENAGKTVHHGAVTEAELIELLSSFDSLPDNNDRVDEMAADESRTSSHEE